MNKKFISLLKAFGIGLKDGLLILIVLAVIAPFVYSETLERTTSSSEVVIGSIDAELPTRPPTPTPGPITQPTPTPTFVPTPTNSPQVPSSGSSGQSIDGGFIRLTIEGLRPGLWTQVQWLAGDGNWYDVNGWGGHLTENHDVLWFVGKNHLGAPPPFRWQVYEAEGGSLLATSDEFHLPQNAKETIQVTVTLSTGGHKGTTGTNR